MFVKLLLAAFLLMHGLIHALFLAPAPAATAGGPSWPFEISRSWVLTPLGLDPGVIRMIGLALFAATVAGFAVAAVATLGALPAGLWVGGVVLGSIASLALLGLFFQPWLVLGVAIDVVLLAVVLGNGWRPEGLGA